MLVKVRESASTDLFMRRWAARDVALDRLRGLAILLMVADHLLIVSGHAGSPWRYTVTRLAMPLFFVLSGHLARRFTDRHVLIGCVGLLLPLVVPFVDSPNVLLWYVLCVPVLLVARRIGPAGLAVLVLVPLLLSANGYDLWGSARSYDPLSLLGLMALGALLPRSSFSAAGRLPAVLGAAGRYPLTWYVGHALVLAVVLRYA